MSHTEGTMSSLSPRPSTTAEAEPKRTTAAAEPSGGAAPATARIVFVAGASFSGSTLMGLMLGSQPEALFAGELKDYKRRMQSEIRGTGSFCSCGESRETCPFWGDVQRRYGLEAELNPAPGFSWRNFVIGLKLLGGFGLGDERDAAHGALVKSIFAEARARDPGLVYVVDTSKSIQNLDAIARTPGVEVSLVHLVRDGMAVAGSYDKRDYPVLPAMAGWAIGNLFVRLYARRRGLRYLAVDYGSLCRGEEGTYRALNRFLGTNIPADTEAVTEQIRATRYHIVSGNGKVRRSASDFRGIRYSESPFDPTGLQRLFGRAVIRPLNRKLGIRA